MDQSPLDNYLRNYLTKYVDIKSKKFCLCGCKYRVRGKYKRGHRARINIMIKDEIKLAKEQGRDPDIRNTTINPILWKELTKKYPTLVPAHLLSSWESVKDQNDSVHWNPSLNQPESRNDLYLHQEEREALEESFLRSLKKDH